MVKWMYSGMVRVENDTMQDNQEAEAYARYEANKKPKPKGGLTKRERRKILKAEIDRINAERDAIRETGGHPDGR